MTNRKSRSPFRYALLHALVLILLFGLPIPGHTGSETSELVVLHTNDHHGHPVKFSHYPSPGAGGLPARATLIREIRNEHENVLVLDAGDLNTGRPESNLFRAEPDIQGYNAIGYDAVALGNHEFDRPLEVLKDQMARVRFPFLSANIRTRDGALLADPYILKDFGEFKVAVFGLTTRSTKYVADPRNVRGLIFEDEIETAEKLVPHLRKKADIVIALVHMGIFPANIMGSRLLASEVPGIDLIVDGHTHSRIDAPVYVENRWTGRRVPIVQAWQWGLVLGRVDLEIQGKNVTRLSFKTIPINLKTVEKETGGRKTFRDVGKPIVEDPALVAKLRPYVEKVERSLSEVIGRAEGSFPHKGARERETALGNLVADAMLWSVRDQGADFALHNAGGIRSGLPAGPITKRLVHEVLPFDNTVVVLTLKGSEVISLFERIGKVRIGSGAFPQVSEGVAFTLDSGARECRNILIHGKPVDPDRVYRVVTHSYLSNGGDGYRMLLNAAERYDTSRFQRDVLMDYIRSLGGRISPRFHRRVTVTGTGGAKVLLKRAA